MARIRGGGSHGVTGPEGLLSLDFTSLDTDDWSSNTAATDVTESIDGVSWTTLRHSSATSFGPLNGTGLQINGSGSSHIRIGLGTLLGGYTAGDYLIIRLTVAYSGSGGLSSALRLRVEDSALANFSSAQLLQTGGNFGWRTRTVRSGGAAVEGALGAPQASTPTSGRVQVDYCMGLQRLRGDLDAGFALPAVDSLPALRDASRTTQSDTAVGGLDITSPVLRLQANTGSVSNVLTLKELAISRLRRS